MTEKFRGRISHQISAPPEACSTCTPVNGLGLGVVLLASVGVGLARDLITQRHSKLGAILDYAASEDG